MRRALKYVGWARAGIAILALAAYFWADHVATSRYEKQWTVHQADFPIPFPLRDDEVAALGAERIAAGGPPPSPLGGGAGPSPALRARTPGGGHIVSRHRTSP